MGVPIEAVRGILANGLNPELAHLVGGAAPGESSRPKVSPEADPVASVGVTADAVAKPRKYRNEPCVVDGIRYDSKKEAQHGQLLAAMERDGLITDLKRQVRFPMVVNGMLVCTYVADFDFRDIDGNQVVQDVKGMKTDVYRIKKKLMRAVHGIDIVEV